MSHLRISRRAQPRRRRRVLVALALLALLVGVVVGAGADGGGGGGASATRASSGGAGATGAGRAASSPVDRLSLRQQVGQLILLRFTGTTPPGYVRAILREGRAAGVILFADNTGAPPQLRTLTRALQTAGGNSVLVSTDQEGGSIRNLRWAGPAEGQGSLAEPDRARGEAGAAGRTLRAAGVNVNLAPVADVASEPGSVMAGRAFPGGASAVSALVAASVAGYAREGVAPTVKHFPGLGPARANTDDGPVTVGRPRGRLLSEDIAPFRAAVRARAPLIMASHALYPALDRARIASQSPEILERLLRGSLHFRGAVVTDSLEAQAVLDRSSVARAALRSAQAGADLLLTTGAGSYKPVFDTLLAQAQRDPAFRARVGRAATRVLALKRSLGLRAPLPFSPGAR